MLPNLFALLAGLAGGTLVGIYLAVSDRYFDLHHNEVFAVQSLIDYRNFLRLHIRPQRRAGNFSGRAASRPEEVAPARGCETDGTALRTGGRGAGAASD